MKEPDDEDYYEYSSLLWYHPDCLKKAMPTLKIKKIKPEDLEGFKILRSADKKKLRDTFGETKEASKTSSDTGKGKGFVVRDIHFAKRYTLL